MIKKIIISVLLVFVLVINANADPRYYDPAETLALAPSTTGDTWYVDGTNGSDITGDGSLAHPWKTIENAFDYQYGVGYGDNLLIKAGTYTVQNLYISRLTDLGEVGSETNRFKIGAYGDGEVIIRADDNHLVTWTAHDANIWKFTYDFKISGNSVNLWTVVLDYNYALCKPVQTLNDVNSDGEWYWDTTTKTCYLYTGGVNPNTRNVIIHRFDEGNSYFGIMSTGDANYITLYGLTIYGAPSIGIYVTGTNLKVEKCKIEFCGKQGIVSGGSGMLVDKCYIYANAMTMWPRGRYWGSNGGWHTGVRIADGDTIQGSIVANSGGEGISIYAGGDPDNLGAIIQDNIVYDNFSSNIYPDSHRYVTIRRNFVFSSGIDETQTADSWTYATAGLPGEGSSATSIRRRQRGFGIYIGDEEASSGGISQGFEIEDNIILACRDGIGSYHQKDAAGWIDHSIYHNTIIMPNADRTTYDDAGHYYGIRLTGDVNNTGTIVKNNLIVATHANTYLICWGATGDGITLDNNTYYHPGNETPFMYDDIAKNFTQWKTAIQADHGETQDANSKNTDPKLANSDWSSYD